MLTSFKNGFALYYHENIYFWYNISLTSQSNRTKLSNWHVFFFYFALQTFFVLRRYPILHFEHSICWWQPQSKQKATTQVLARWKFVQKLRGSMEFSFCYPPVNSGITQDNVSRAPHRPLVAAFISHCHNQ